MDTIKADGPRIAVVEQTLKEAMEELRRLVLADPCQIASSYKKLIWFESNTFITIPRRTIAALESARPCWYKFYCSYNELPGRWGIAQLQATWFPGISARWSIQISNSLMLQGTSAGPVGL